MNEPCKHGVTSGGHFSTCADCTIEWLQDPAIGAAALIHQRNPTAIVFGIETVAFLRGWNCDELAVVMPLQAVQMVLRSGTGARPLTFNGRRGLKLPGGHADLRVFAAPREDTSGDVTVERHGDVILRLPGKLP